ncbi:MAG: hypothetical protein A3G77_07135 [Acidobacteria bacterium RIFCSPLOWO2_12_FULL_68_19]|nr:MAG: hypothetical protein A3G77_07135 [Acidobacteria bacterium RIFCSPLOWO2_12_FULL_68_19]
MYRRVLSRLSLLIVAVLIAGCAAGRAFSRGESATRAGDWDAAVEHYRAAVQANPNRADYQIALERAMLNASNRHLDQARVFEARGQIEDALREYRRASEYNPTNRQVAGKALEMERRLRDLAETARPSLTLQQLQQAARQTPAPLLNPASREPIDVVFNNAALRDILASMGTSAGINVTFERDYQDRSYSVQLRGVTFEQAITQIVSANQLFYKVINERTIMVIPDNAQKRALYEEQVIRTFFISHADATEVAQILNGVIRIPALAVAPQIVANKTNNTITVRASANIVQIIERVIEQNDNPKAEIVIDVQILEVNRRRTKEFGIDLSEFAITAAFSPETDPRGDDASLTTQPFNLNTVTRGISTADFYLSVPAAVVRFLETDSETRLIAKPQLRGAEGQQINLNLGDQIPVPATVFTPIAQGGANFNPLTSFNYRDVGVNVQMTPRVTVEGDIILDLMVENSTLGASITIAGQELPSFGSRRVQTRLRLRDGESNLLAGLLREEDRRSLSGIPGLLRLPVLRSLFAANENRVEQTDIVMLLTPRIVRTQELTANDVSPIFIGSQQSLGLGGPPPLIAAPAPTEPAAAPGGATPLAPAGGTPPVAVQGGAVGGQLMLSPPGPEFRVGAGPYTVPVSISGASQISSVTLTITFNPAALRVRAIQEGSFMRTGGIGVAFTQQVDAAAGRIDIAAVRSDDPAGVAGTGLLAAVVFDAVGGGTANLAVTGAATAPRGTPVPLQFAPVPAVVVK